MNNGAKIESEFCLDFDKDVEGWSALVDGLVAAPVMAMMVLANRSRVMGQFTLEPVLSVNVWLATAVMSAAAIGMLATLGH